VSVADHGLRLAVVDHVAPHAATENFDSIINGGKHALVEFYAPW
jgi:hypothetical protein